MRMRGILSYMSGLCSPPRRGSTTWRIFYLPMLVFLSGFLYFYVSLMDNVPRYYVIDGAPSWRGIEASKTPEVMTEARRQWTLPNLHKTHGMFPPLKQLESQGNYKMSSALGNNSNKHPAGGMIRSIGARNAEVLKPKPVPTIPFLKKWNSDKVEGCGGRFVGYSGKMILLKDVIVNRSLATAGAKGGENIMSVKNRPEESENYSYERGFFTITCPEGMAWEKFKIDTNKGYLKPWYETLTVASKESASFDDVDREERFSLAITRYEYANLYWTLMDIYDALLALTFFGEKPKTTHIVLMDAKPWSHLDALWTTFFGSVRRLSDLKPVTNFAQMAWSFQRAHSPALNRQLLPLHAEFRSQMLSSFNVSQTLHPPGGRYGNNCSSTTLQQLPLNVLIIWRRNYVAHPRNPSGIVSRKIANEEELLNATTHAFPAYTVRGVQLDKLRMREQLELIAGTDVMIGMHGAAFAFAWFLPKGSGVIEMFPANQGGNWHMRHIAENNGVHYAMWKNKNPRNELFHSKSTIIPPSDAIREIRNMVERLCWNKNPPDEGRIIVQQAANIRPHITNPKVKLPALRNKRKKT